MFVSFILFLFTHAQTTKRAQRMHTRHERQWDENDKKCQRQEWQQLKGADIWHRFEFDVSRDKVKKSKETKHFSQGAMVNVIQFITVKEKSYIIHVMFYFNDLSRVVYQEIIQKREKAQHLKSAVLWVVSLTTSSKWVWSCEQRE